eukprot:27187_1
MLFILGTLCIRNKFIFHGFIISKQCIMALQKNVDKNTLFDIDYVCMQPPETLKKLYIDIEKVWVIQSDIDSKLYVYRCSTPFGICCNKKYFKAIDKLLFIFTFLTSIH